jgi:nucleotide-binding universal stress UspA family protein
VKQLHRILVAVDFSKPARAAYDRALALSRKHDAELLVVHAVPADRPFNWEGRERAVLVASLRRAAHAAGVHPKVSIQHGDPAGVILLHARSRAADLIVMGTNERSGLDHFRFGSVAETVALQATQPVLVVPAADQETGDRLAPFTNIVVAVDLSEGSSAAIERALAIADDNSRITVVHVVAGMAHAGASRYMYGLMEPEYHRHVAADARRKIAALIPSEVTAQRKVHVRVVSGDPAAEISRVASETGADVVLVGVSPRGAIGRRVFRSTAARVIRNADVPVLAVAA